MDKIIPGLYFSILALCLTLWAPQAKAQDSLRMRTGAIYSVKIIEITDSQVKYRTYSNPDGPLYNVSKSSISRIKLEGKSWEFLQPESEVRRREEENRTADRHHYIGMNVLDLIRTDLTVYYEWLFANDKIGLRLPVTYGFRSAYLNPNSSASNPFGFRRNTVFRTGIDLRIYSGEGLRKVRFVFGPSVNYLRLNRIPSDYFTYDKDFMVFKSANALRIMFYNGISIRPVDYLQLGFDMAVGGDIDLGENHAGSTNYYITGTPTVPKIQFALHMGYRF